MDNKKKSRNTKRILSKVEEDLIREYGIKQLRISALHRISARFCQKESVRYSMDKNDISKNIFNFVSDITGIPLDSEKEATWLMENIIRYINGPEKGDTNEITDQINRLNELKNQNDKTDKILKTVREELETNTPTSYNIVMKIGKDLKTLDLNKLKFISLNLFSKLADPTTDRPFAKYTKGSNCFNLARKIANIKPGTEPLLLPDQDSAIDMIYSQLIILTDPYYEINSEYFVDEKLGSDDFQKLSIVKSGQRELNKLKGLN